MKWNENETLSHLKVTHVIQQKIYSNINKLTEKIKRTSKEMPENKTLFAFLTFVQSNSKKFCLHCEHSENGFK